MQRVKRPTAVAVLPAAPAGGVPGYFAQPNPSGGIAATVPGHEWYNGVQEELMAVIEGTGAVPDAGKNNQLVTAIQSGKLFTTAAGGTADALTGTFSPVISGLVAGMTFYVRAGAANATTTPTFTPAAGTIAAKTIVKGAGAALSVGDIAGAGHWIELQFDVTLNKWVLQNPALFNQFGVSFGLSGYQKLPSGLIIQWMPVLTTVFSNGFNYVTLPIAFPNAHLASFVSASNVSNGVFGAEAYSVTQARVTNSYTGAQGGTLFSIGR